ncbi:hypothetical protein NYD60_16405 [Burkholderia thailandensis]|uniref:hypothetical protein n=1 Tax=Burkholderia thailandensis TaxID=57975 RepID=UPI0012E749CA|nr:hypothetical protein [Burkholderia thailandensis]MCS6473749.1 hypothetical protein [Burkholderia thailandensis]MCS6501589.1 hypothetical protein [Burkholderia thailandensis]MUV22906.1 hypothetical protein [Burkholderia thailandensis]
MNEREKSTGRRLRPALHSFAKSLMEEVLIIGDINLSVTEDIPGLTIDKATRYRRFTPDCMARAPQAASIQALENKVASLLGRQAHTVEIAHKPSGKLLARPTAGLNLRMFDASELELVYGDGWPTFSQLTGEDPSLGPTHYLYWWQWGVLWERGHPLFSRSEFGLGPNEPVDGFAARLIERATKNRAAFSQLVDAEYHWTRSEVFEFHLGPFSDDKRRDELRAAEDSRLHSWIRANFSVV